jgi:small subunit ribosomal protein S7
MRKHSAERREVDPDPVYDSVLINRIINKFMLDGKKSLAESMVYNAVKKVGEEIDEKPISAVKEALDNIMPALEVRSRRVGGSNYQIPVEVDDQRKVSLALRWLVEATRGRNERTMIDKLANELVEAYKNSGGAVRKKEEVHRQAEANRAFAHYRW